MAVNIGPVIGVDGEKEFRKQINQCVQVTKTLDSEMKALTSSFDGNERSQSELAKQSEILTKQVGNQQDKLELLQKGLAESTKKYGENDTRTQKWAQAVYEATAHLNRMTAELGDVSGAMTDAVNGTGDMETAMEQAADAADDLADSAHDTSLSFDDLLGANLVSSAISYMADTIKTAAEETKEYRKIMGSLEVSSEKAGYTARQTAETYTTLYGVLADDQTAATTAANLQALGLSQDELRKITNATIGAWATYGDSIPIDSLSEAINETAKTGTVTGTFADVLNWAGESENGFNAELQSTNDISERTRKILTVMTKQGLEKAGQAWQSNNKTLVESNKATAKQQKALAELGATIEPLLTEVTGLTANLFEFIADNGKTVITVASGIGAAFAAWKVTNALDAVSGSWGKFIAAITTADPVAIATAGITGLVAAAIVAGEEFGGASEQIRSEMDAMAEAGQAMKETADGFDDAMNGLESTSKKMEASGVYAEDLGTRLTELAEKTDRTNTEQAEMGRIVEKLNSLFPDLGLTINDTTGELNMSTSAIESYISKASEMAKMEKIQEHYADAVGEVTEMEIARAEAEIAAQDAVDKLTDLDTQREKILKKVNAALDDGADAAGVYNSTMVEYNGKTMSAADALEQLNSDAQALRDSHAELNGKIDEQNAKITSANEQLAVYDQVMQSVTGTTRDSAVAYNEQGLAATSAAASADLSAASFLTLQGAQAAYTTGAQALVSQMEQSIAESLQSQMSMFEEFNGGVELSTTELLNNMQSQIDGVTNWESNLAMLADRGINQSLLQYLVDMGPKGANYVKTFANMTESEFEQANSMWQQGLDVQGMANQTGKDLISALGGNVSTAMSSVSATGYNAAYSSGENISAGMRDGVASGAASVANAVARIALDAINAGNKTLGIHSPSKIFERIGAYTAEGFVVGLDKTQDAVNDAVASLFTFGNLYDSPSGSYPAAAPVMTAGAGVSITVNAAPGQSEDAIANKVMYKLQHNVAKAGAVW